jgi:protein SCO1/2/putative membrane protein
VSRSYRLGIQIVLGTVLISAIVCWIGVSRGPAVPSRAGQDLGAGALPLGEFQFTERSGRTITQVDLNDRVWIASFIFTRCPLSCPRISSVMKDLQGRLARSNALLVSISVDPDHDTAPVLKEYADRFGAQADRWWFLTGGKAPTYDLIQNGFKLALAEATGPDRAGGAEAFSHSDRLALVDRGQVVGFFDTSDPSSLDELVVRARRLAQPGWVRVLPTINASLNGLCAVLLVAGWVMIRRRSPFPSAPALPPGSEPAGRTPLLQRPAVRAHIASMLLAVATSAIFLACYLVYHYQAGSMPFRHDGGLRWMYLTILLSHTILATFGVVPLVMITLFRAARGDYARHLRIAQVTFPIWLYVSVTGVVIYLLLYHLPVATSAGQTPFPG